MLIFPIKIYQQALAPLLGPCCRFTPNCSDYAITALQRFGPLKGGWLAIKRLLRCQPLSRGGCDAVPPNHCN